MLKVLSNLNDSMIPWSLNVHMFFENREKLFHLRHVITHYLTDDHWVFTESVMVKLFSICCQIYFKKHCSSLPLVPTQICQCKLWHQYKHFVIVGLDNGKALCNMSCLLNLCAIQYCWPGCHCLPKGIFFFLKCYTHTKNFAERNIWCLVHSFSHLQRVIKLLNYSNQTNILYIYLSAQE